MNISIYRLKKVILNIAIIKNYETRNDLQIIKLNVASIDLTKKFLF